MLPIRLAVPRDATAVRLLSTLALLFTLTGSAHAQTASPAQGAFADTNATFFGRLGMHPHYGTTLTLQEQSNTWGQAFDFAKALGPVRTKSRLDLVITKNSSQNNYRKNGGKGHVELAYEAENLGGLSSGTLVDWRRSLDRSDFSRSVENGSEVDFFLTSTLPEALLRDLFVMADSSEGLSWDATAAYGLTQGKSIRQDRSRARPDRALVKSDSTDTQGSEYRFDTRLNAGPGDVWGVNLTANSVDGREDSRTESRSWTYFNNPGTPPDTSDVILDEPNKNRMRAANANFRFRPGRVFEFAMTGAYNRSRQQLYDFSTRAQDTRNVLDHRVEGTLKSRVTEGVDLELAGRSALSDSRSLNQNQNSGKRENWGEVTLGLVTGDWMGLFRAVELTTELESAETAYRYASTSDYRSKLFRINEVIRRRLNDAVTLSGQAEGRINSFFYNDKSQDKDELRYLGSGTLAYRPGGKFDARLTSDWTQTNVVNLPSARSRDNYTESSYRVAADYNFKLSPNVTLGQKYQLSAVYSVFDFDENSNSLTRTTAVNTILTSFIGENVRLNLEHKYTFKDSGKYVHLQLSDPRVYAKSNEDNAQYMTVVTQYLVGQDFDFHANQRFEVRSQKTLASGNITRRTQLDFSGGVKFDHQYSSLFSINATIDRTNRNPGKDYWSVRAGMDRRF